MAATAGEIAAAAATNGAGTLRVGWIGGRPSWLALVEGTPELDGARLVDGAGGANVLHVAGSELRRLRALRAAHPKTPIVLDLSGDGEVGLGRLDANRARLAQRVLVGSEADLNDLRRRQPALGARAEVLPQPIDLDAHVPLRRLHETRDAEVKRFRRLHRVAGALVLFGGPYTREGGFHLALDAVYKLRERMPELRVAAVPHGRIDPRYRDDCERRSLALGHHGTVEWSPSPSDLPLWYGIATVVCTPASGRVSPAPARLAAAAERPFVGSRVEGLADAVVDGETGFLVPPGDEDTLTAALESLLADNDEATRLGAAARRKAEEELSPAVAAARLCRIWRGAADGDGRATTIGRH